MAGDAAGTGWMSGLGNAHMDGRIAVYPARERHPVDLRGTDVAEELAGAEAR